MAIPVTVEEVGQVAEQVSKKPLAWMVVILVGAVLGLSWRLLDVENKRDKDNEAWKSQAIQYEKDKAQIATDCLLERLKTSATIDDLKRIILEKEQPINKRR